ncbi:hypothetical protein, partial [Dickeya solani]
IWFTNSERMFNRKRSEITGDLNPMEGGCLGFVSRSGSGMTMVLGWFDEDLATLVHEVSHVVIYVFDAIGMDPSVYTTEAFAYLAENIFSQCLDAIALSKKSLLTGTEHHD